MVFGQNGLKASILAIGGYGPRVALNLEEGLKAFENTFEKGISMVDVASSYGRLRPGLDN